MENNSENITLFSDDTFYILKIDEGQISHLDWNNPDYVQMLVSLPIISTHLVTRDNFMSKIYELLNLQPHTHLITETIWEEPNYTYQIIFIDTLNKLTTLNKNEFASMLNISGEIINGKAIVIKNFVSTTTNEISLQSMNSSELHRILKARGYTKIVVFEDDMWRETEVYGDIELYAKKFFEDEYYMKKELGFLQHNINIMYTNSEYGTKIGNILDNKVDKCIIYTMVTDSIRGCITKDEVLKIITLSTKLNVPYTCKDEDMNEEFDEHGRRMVKNKYRTLDSYYNKI